MSGFVGRWWGYVLGSTVEQVTQDAPGVCGSDEKVMG